ncbi:AP-1 complex subunit gamma [Gracilariopsis chorda]|uniref:AP-1 complex subunit gamma n=1 Tax=Gracilariopsis chorda TaxID=448386 RepID=A0A2V3IIZ6_9FLOR|nr:AP-1 complex subunit gamma [Gracilariopsis chorda]|eukprot:PXF42042.1 AP-1 complex subunit gamma [Gracilariopsis chorda]
MRMPEDLVSSFLAMISTKPDVRAHAVALLFSEAFSKKPEEQRTPQQQKNLLEFGDAPKRQPDHVVFIDPRNRKLRLERVAVYVMGEYGETTSSIGLQMNQVLAAYRQILASAKTVEDIWLDADAATRNEEMQKLTEITLTSLVKFVCRHSSPQSEGDTGLDSLFQALPAPSSSPVKESTLADDLLDSLNLGDEKPSQSLVPVSSHSGITSNSLVSIEHGQIDSGITTGGSIPDQVCYILSAHANSVDIEVQQRACEYMTLLKEDLRPALTSVMAHLPQLDFAAVQKKANQRRESATATTANGTNQNEVLLDLLGDMSSEAGPAYPALPSTDGTGMDSIVNRSGEKDTSLFDVLGGAGVQPKESESTDSDNLMNLLAMPNVDKPSLPSTAPSELTQVGLTNEDPSELEPVFNSESLIVKAVRSQEMEHAGFAERVNLICTNKSSMPIHNFTLMLAFPKYIEFEIHPLSSDEIAAGDHVTQIVSYINASSENRPFRMRFKLEFQLQGSESLSQYEGIFPDTKGV